MESGVFYRMRLGGGLELGFGLGWFFVPDVYDDLAPGLALFERIQAIGKTVKREDIWIDDGLDAFRS